MESIASTSAAGNQLHRRHEIFINHRGPDAKLSFVAHLADALRRKHYTPFVDKDDISKGEKGTEEMQAALEGASVQLAVITPGYAESRHCLNELVAMLKRCEQFPENVKLVPVFFNVKPGDLRRPDEKPFQAAFQDHERKASALVDEQLRKDEQERIKMWKNALFETADRDGFELSAEAGDENKLKHKIVDRIEGILGSRIVRKQPVPHPSVGLQTLFTHIEGELDKMRDKVTILGIWGMGGIGKTTLAKELYNRYTEHYELYTFVNIGGAKTMEDLQKQVVFDLLGRKDESILEKYKGWFQELVQRRVLLVIDNISKEDDFTRLAPDMKSLGIGSLVIVTSRDQHVLNLIVRDSDGFHLHEMKELDRDASLELFSFHAFENRRRLEKTDGLHPLADNIVFRCGGLPLALEIIGKHLYAKEKDVWKELVQSMEVPHVLPHVLDVLSISYQGLPSKFEKMMFLDVACQMIGMLEDDAVDIWKSCALGNSCRRPRCWTSRRVRDSLSILKDKALVKVDSDNRLTMHDLLREMGRMLAGRDTVHGEPRDLEEHSHLWDVANVEAVLNEGKETKHIRGLSLALKHRDTIQFDASKLQKTIAIHFLQLDRACVEGDFSKWSSDIRWLQWRASSLKRLPSELRFPFLTHLDLSHSKNLTRLWSDDDTQVPKFLRVLNLAHCSNLEEIPENVKFLTKLKRLNLCYCDRLISLPSSLGRLIELEELDLNQCFNLKSLPGDIANLSSLKILTMERCSRITLPDDVGKLGALVKLSLTNATGLTWLPNSSSQLSLLEKLSLESCYGLSESPKSVKGLVKLRVLRLSATKLTELPIDFGDLEYLVELYLKSCWNLESLPENFGRLKRLKVLNLTNCLHLQMLFSNFGQLSSLMDLDLSYSPLTEEGFPHSFGGLCCLSTLHMQGSHLTRLSTNFSSLTTLVRLDMQYNKSLVEIRSLPPMLGVLDVSYCPCLTCIPTIENLRKLILRECRGLIVLQGLERMEALEEIDATGCYRLTNVYDGLLFNPELKRCFINGSDIPYLKYNNNWSEVVPNSQVVCIKYIVQQELEDDELEDDELEDEELEDEEREESNFKGGDLRRSMVITISNEKRVDAVIIIICGTRTEFVAHCDFEARILRSNVDVYCSKVFSIPSWFIPHWEDMGFIVICILRRSHPLVKQLQYGNKLYIYSKNYLGDYTCSDFIGEGKILVVYDTQHDLDNLKSIFTNMHSIIKLCLPKFGGPLTQDWTIMYI